MNLKVIITGATGLVGEGVLLECLANPNIKQVLMVNRRPATISHTKLKELIIPDFFDAEKYTARLTGYDACFYCAGISSQGMKEARYSYITYDTTMHFATLLAGINPNMVFNHISGSHTDGSEKGSIMWARVKGKTENALIKLPFKAVYNFRPGFMKPTEGQKNVKGYYKVISGMYPFLKLVFPKQVLTMSEVGRAMINAALKGYFKQILEIKDIKSLAAQ